MPSAEELYGELWADQDNGLETEVDESLRPRPTETLYDAFGALGAGPDDVVLDVGCGYGGHSVELVRRFGCRVIAADPIPRHLEKTRKRVAEEGVGDRVTVPREAGFQISAVDEIDSEWREFWLETGDRRTVDDLLRAARLRRRETELVARYGRDSYEAALAGSVWGVYQLLGKLCLTVYVPEKPIA